MSKFETLLVIDGVKLYGLLSNAHDKKLLQRFDLDYLPQLKSLLASPDANVRSTAAKNLIFLNAFLCSDFDNNFKPLENLGKYLSNVAKRGTYNRNNGAKRCVLSRQSTSIQSNSISTLTISDLVDGVRAAKKKARKNGLKYEPYEPCDNTLPAAPILPVKVFSDSEKKAFATQYFNQKVKT